MGTQIFLLSHAREKPKNPYPCLNKVLSICENTLGENLNMTKHFASSKVGKLFKKVSSFNQI